MTYSITSTIDALCDSTFCEGINVWKMTPFGEMCMMKNQSADTRHLDLSLRRTVSENDDIRHAVEDIHQCIFLRKLEYCGLERQLFHVKIAPLALKTC